MKKLKAILSISLIGILLFSTVGFSVSRHYCMGMLMDESFYSISEGCEVATGDDCDNPEESIKTDCCDDENLIFAGIDVISIIKKQLDFTPALPEVFSPNFAFTIPQNTDYKLLSFFPPPEPLPYGKNLLVKVQRFLI
ncbi:HYC_CC_PP family protein [Owenweeksia hongkongensis]|nr:hypothetical protein [Owenweeksia hongkongensis]